MGMTPALERASNTTSSASSGSRRFFLGAGLDSKERRSRSDGYGLTAEPVADKSSGRACKVLRRRGDGAVCGSFDWRQPAHGDLILPQTAGSDRSALE